jgi:hypothetical protein
VSGHGSAGTGKIRGKGGAVVVAGWEGGEKGAAGEKMRRRGDMAVDPEK